MASSPAIFFLLCFSISNLFLGVNDWGRWNVRALCWDGGSDPVWCCIAGMELWFWCFACMFCLQVGIVVMLRWWFYEWECCGKVVITGGIGLRQLKKWMVIILIVLWEGRTRRKRLMMMNRGACCAAKNLIKKNIFTIWLRFSWTRGRKGTLWLRFI